MIKGTGIDICSVKRITRIINNDKTDFIDNTFHKCEIEEANKYEDPSQFYASRFAAKEAFLKAMELGLFNSKISLNEIAIIKEKTGKPSIKIYKHEMTNEFADLNIHLSISHEENICIAYVVIETA